ncbi:type II toxin-antitoxin system HicB family antitoxin [Ignavigranum ruoffiae]|uniref:type II toxin-antitoxin system HicB family antitoxin n=1 Tax=Ignavigranum ruoffiae TaxID=89093 RepID=UPI002051D1E3|nr:type II toxin-antitoxin system HicB family antitoxin [Ignavigranum ruoffiae]UPQ85108.1 type II toxin-antitoxin system HicB family antitoxin [Ignavigranum ruoffiae]
MKAVYPAIFYYDNNSNGYFITFPDFEQSATQGDTINEAMEMAAEYLGMAIADIIESNQELPTPSNINGLSLTANHTVMDDDEFETFTDLSKSFISLVPTDVSQYLGMDKLVKKTLTIPKWADTIGKELRLNFSQTLTEAIAQKN